MAGRFSTLQNFNSVPFPVIPGNRIDFSRAEILKKRINSILGAAVNFPGSQPVSFTLQHLIELEKEDYYVCEKSDGARVLLYIRMDKNGDQDVYLNHYFHLPGVKFPIPNTNVDPNTHNWDSLVDGELVYDVEPDGSRLFLLIKDYNKLILRNNPQFANNQPFKFAFKEMEKSYGLEKVIKETTLKLKHKSDGLIFTSADLKWKPPNENSIDFLLKVEHDQNKEMPRFCLFQRGNNGYEYFNDMSVTYEQWKMWIDNNEKLNERLVEVVCNPSSSSWQFLRFRDDKLQPNFSTVVDKILQSIKDGVDKETLILQSNKIRDSWKRREQERKQRVNYNT
ncbi:2569_t:CDS:2 [Entrophospora sp. SA101]|nr:20438_t:CDS:2 [Entrophospora sp. SA101]CAJ0908666.1 2569_t:CDS:2 [Entrophospora sp. SA101]